MRIGLGSLLSPLFGAFEDGSSFVTGVLGKLPTELAAQVKAVLDKPEAKDAVTLIGESVLARSDYSKKMDALNKDIETQKTQLTEKFTELNTWYANNQAALKEYPALKAEYERLKSGAPADDEDDPEKGKKGKQPDIRDVALEVVNEVAPEYIGVTAWLNDKRAEHESLFKDGTVPFSATQLTRNPKLGKPIAGQPGRVYSLEDAYIELYGEKVTAKRKEIETAQIETKVQERLKEERAKLVGQPFPLRTEAAPSVLDVLATKDGSAVHTLDSAVAEYERLQAARTGP